MSRRFAWAILPAIALGASAAGARTPATAPARTGGTAVIAMPSATAGDTLIAVGATDIADTANDGATFPVVANGFETPSTDLGVAAAALANGPVRTAARRPGANSGQANVAAKSRARLPEPATWLMLIGGMYGIGAALRRRHRASEAAFTAKLRAIVADQDAADDK